MLNKQLKWQIKNINRGIKYITLDLEHIKLFIFINGSFINNKDFSSQIGYLIILVNKTKGTDEFVIKGNLIHYSSTKSNTIIKIIIRQLGFLYTLIIVYTNLYLLYKYLVKLGTTKEKYLIIDIIALRQLYKRREIIEI